MITLKESIAQVVEARQACLALTAKHREALAEWTAAHQTLIDDLAAARAAQEEAEGKLRAEALSIYQETGNKKPAPGVEVKVGKQFVYDSTAALEWGYGHRMALSLDKRAFEKIAAASSLAFVEIQDKPFVTLATELKADNQPGA